MAAPLISVILPVYNREEFVEDAIHSILNQTEENFELLIIDDGSQDASVHIIKKILDPRIKLIVIKKNSGVSVSRNRGIYEAKGEFIAFMDSDDISIPRRFAEQLAIFKDKPDVSVCGSWVRIFQSEKILRYKEYHHELVSLMLKGCPLSLSSVMCRREVFGNFKFDENLEHGEDYDLWSRIMWQYKFYNVQKPLLLYREHAAQLSRQNLKKQRQMDVHIQMSLFRTLSYSRKDFPDEVLIRILSFNSYFRAGDMKIILKWLRFIQFRNEEQRAFPKKEFTAALEEIRRNVLFQIYFKKSNFGINRAWRFKILQYLSKEDFLMICRGKLREYVKQLKV